MKRVVCLAVLLITAFIGASPSEAAITLSAGTSNNFGAGTTAGLTGPNGTVANQIIGATAVSFDLTFLKAGAPVSLSFNVDTTGIGVGVPVLAQTFLVTVKTINGITPFNTGVGFAMNGFDVVAVDANPVAFPNASLASVQPTSVAGTGDAFAALPISGNPIENVSQGGYRFGGWNGGGGEIYNGEFNTNTFAVTVVSTANGTVNSAFNLVFTANPEPTTLILGSLVMAPAAFALRRRRKVEAQESVEAV